MIPVGIISYNSEIIGNFERNEAFSVELWLYGSIPRPSALCSRMTNDGGHKGWVFYASGGRNNWNTIGFALVSNELNNNFLHVITSVGQVSFIKDTWHHIICTYNGNSSVSGIKCYVDGISKSFTIVRDTLTANIQNNTSKLEIGHAPIWDFFGGRIDEFIIYDRVIPHTEVIQRYNSGVGTETLFGSIYLQYKLNEITGDSVIDSSGNNRNGNTINSPLWVPGKLNNCVQLNGSTQKIEA